jgi:hypothetical protein
MNHRSPTTRPRHARSLRFISLLALFASGCDPEIIGLFRGPAAAQRIPRADAAQPAHAPTAGDPCRSWSDCGAVPGANCLAWPGGYCSGPCEPDGACLEGVCADPDHPAHPGPRCLRECADDGECRAGYACRATVDGLVCAPAL